MILMIGDPIHDHYIRYEKVGECPEGGPIVREVSSDTKPGGVLALRDMVAALYDDCHLVSPPSMISRKTRVLLDGKLMYRIDADKQSGYAGNVVTLINDGVLGRMTPDVVLLSDYGKGAIDRSVVEACLNREWKVIADPHHTTDPSVFEGVWGITPNGRENAEDCYYGGPWERACLTCGEDGIMARGDGETFETYSLADHPIVDVCGCGDIVLAVIGVCIARGMSWLDACEWANKAAGIKCGKRGAVPVTAAELGLPVDSGQGV